MLIPPPFNFVSIFFDQLGNLVQFMATEIARSRQFKRSHPKLRIPTAFSNVNVHRFTTVKAEKEETISSKVMRDWSKMPSSSLHFEMHHMAWETLFT
jgi:hypothetical protein